ncbi:MAG: hypothetical protein DME25_08770 [Verrucomicrobia bacterium]|nr:MAG: hypothetical protein DME25_08770 [Verrucomicrobiota bacterium]
MKFEILNPKFLKLVQAGIGLLLVATLYSTAQEELGRRPRTDVTLLDTQETDQDRFWFRIGTNEAKQLGREWFWLNPTNVVQFQSVFNGKDLTGWDGNPKLWSVKDGAITGQTTAENPAKGNTFLIWTNGTVADFELRCSFKIVPGDAKGFGNSGIQYRSKILNAANWVVGGYQADMEAGPTYTGILYEERMTRGIMAARGEKVVWDKDCNKQVVGSLGKSEELQAAIRKEDWNTYDIIAVGNHLHHFINGKQTVDVIDDVLALQLHAGPPMMVQFRDIRLWAPPAGDQASADDLQKLQGAWQPTGGEANGEAIPSDDLAGMVVTIKGNSYTATRSEGTDRGIFTILPTKQPKQMDIRPQSGPDEGSTLPAIYEVGPDSFRICLARPDAPRPASFSTSSDSTLMVITYKRKK